jgi:catechol 2,3-dioxygenase-like lactoylglutathione lyase family enzyme
VSGPRTIHHTGFTVGDLDRSLSFYRDLLGLETLAEQEKKGGYLDGIPVELFQPPRRAETGADG